MNKIIIILSIFLISFSYRLFFSDNSYINYLELREQVLSLQEENKKFLEKIKILKSRVKNLKTSDEFLEEKARNELGLVKEGEVFYHVIN